MSENQKTTTKKSKKGKTIPLTDFLAETPKTVTVRANWSEIVDSEEAETKPIVVNIGVLPTAPRNATDIDPSSIPSNPPFVAHIANLSFEIDDEGLRRIFADLTTKSARVLRDGMRSRGIGLVDFETREHLIEALKRTDKEVYGRKIRVTVSDKTDMHQTDGGRGTFGNNRSNRGGGGGEERPEMADKWKRAEPRSNDTHDDRQSSGFNRDRQNRGDHGRSNMGGGSRDNHGNDFGFGYPRTRDDRGGGQSGGNRDYNRQGQRNNRNYDDENRSNSGTDRPRYSGRYSDTRDTRDRNQTNDEPRGDDQQEPPRERQRLQLQPRTKPLEEFEPLSGSSSSVNNVAANAGQSSISNADDSSSSIANRYTQQTQDSSINEHRDDNQHEESRNSNDQVNTPDEQSTVKPSRGAGASIFGGAKPVDTTAREREIEKKLSEIQITSSETTGDSEEKTSSTKPTNYRTERDVYRAKRPSHNDEHRDRDRDRRDDGRSGHGTDYHHKREFSGGRQYEDEGRRRQDDEHPPHRGGYDRDRLSGGQSRRDPDSGRSNKFNQPDRNLDRGNNRNREREDRNQDPDEFSTYGRPSNNHNTDSNSRTQQRGVPRRNVQVQDEANKVQLSNKFSMLDDDDDVDNENDDAQSPSIDE
ncbi:hypothetical protein I4U23_021320 [Adineta vaga]|nr:hypothetical protein I4U23_021320 [Adineta vaga]